MWVPKYQSRWKSTGFEPTEIVHLAILSLFPIFSTVLSGTRMEFLFTKNSSQNRNCPQYFSCRGHLVGHSPFWCLELRLPAGQNRAQCHLRTARGGKDLVPNQPWDSQLSALWNASVLPGLSGCFVWFCYLKLGQAVWLLPSMLAEASKKKIMMGSRG